MHVIQCKKIWRFQLNYYYDGFMLENAQDPSLVKPLRRDCWFVTDADYNAYDTLQVVDNLQNSCGYGCSNAQPKRQTTAKRPNGQAVGAASAAGAGALPPPARADREKRPI